LKSKRIAKKIANERIYLLLELAQEYIKQNPLLAKRYVELARRIAKRTNVRIPKTLKRRFCKRCNEYLIPGYNARVRIKNKVILITCLKCGKIKRLGVGDDDRL